MGDESRFRYRLLDEGQARDGSAAGGTRATAQDPRRLETRARSSRDYGRADTSSSYMPSAQPGHYADDGYGRAPAKSGATEDSLAELAKLIGDEDPFADFGDMEPGHAGPAEDDDYDAPQSDARGERFSAPVPVRGQTSARAYAPEPATRSARTAADARDYDDPYDTGRGYRADEAGYDDGRYESQRYDDDDYGAGQPGNVGYDAPASYGTGSARSQGAPSPGAGAYDDDYAPAPRGGQLPARLSASREVQAPVSRPTAGAVRTGYGSLARQAAVANPRRDETPAYDDRETDAHGYGRKGYDSRGYADDDYDDRAPSERGYSDRGYDDQGYEAEGQGRRGRAAGGYDARGYDDRAGYDDRRYDERGQDDRGYDDRGYDADGRGGYSDEAGYAYAGQSRGDDGYDAYDNTYDPEFADDGYMPPHGQDLYEAEPRRRKGRMALLMAVSAIGLLVAGVAVFFAYRMAVGAPGLVSSGSGTPVIKADSSPAKVVTQQAPANDGQQKLIYDRVGGGPNPNEQVVPREEQPVDVATASTGTTGTAGASGTEPKRVRTLTVRSDGSIIQGGAASEAGSSVSSYAADQNPIPTGLPDPTPVNTVRTSGAQTASANPPVSANGAFVVQVASQRSEADAMGSWRALQTRYPSLLSGYRASVKRADLGERGVYYRAQVGPFASRDQANDLCQALRAQGGDCLVSKN